MFFVSPFASEATTRIYIVIIYCTYLMRRKLSLSSGVSFLPKILLLSSFLQKKKKCVTCLFLSTKPTTGREIKASAS